MNFNFFSKKLNLLVHFKSKLQKTLLEEKEFIEQLLNPKTQNDAFQKLLHSYQKPLYNHIRNIVLSHDDTDDVLQNTFIKVFQNLKNFKGESKLFSWIYRIATNEALTFLNQKAKKVEYHPKHYKTTL